MRFGIFLCLFFSFSCAFSQSDNFRVKQFNLDNGVAIKGYDPVAYFTQNKAVKGKKDLFQSYHGVIYQFATESDRQAFQSNPAKYEPRYGGWCAYAMGHDGSKVEIDPETFKIKDGKLFLFYNHFFTNTLKSWNLDEPNLYSHAENNWEKITQQ